VNRIGGRNTVSKGLDGGRGAFGRREREREGEGGRRRRGQNPSDVLLSDGAGLGEEILEGNGLVALGGGGVDGGGICVSVDVGGVVGVGAGDDLLPDVIDGLGGGGGDGLEEVVHGGRVVQIGEKRGKGRYRRVAWQIRIRRDNLRRRHAAFQAVFFSLLSSFSVSLSSTSTISKELTLHTTSISFLIIILSQHFHSVSLVFCTNHIEQTKPWIFSLTHYIKTIMYFFFINESHCYFLLPSHVFCDLVLYFYYFFFFLPKLFTFSYLFPFFMPLLLNQTLFTDVYFAKIIVRFLDS